VWPDLLNFGPYSSRFSHAEKILFVILPVMQEVIVFLKLPKKICSSYSNRNIFLGDDKAIVKKNLEI
jgi:hypothetical protein